MTRMSLPIALALTKPKPLRAFINRVSTRKCPSHLGNSTTLTAKTKVAIAASDPKMATQTLWPITVKEQGALQATRESNHSMTSLKSEQRPYLHPPTCLLPKRSCPHSNVSL